MNRTELQEEKNALQAEYVRNLNCNYVRVLLRERPEENRYQYCILNRGGIRYLLPCSLRYMNGEAFLYYDISSTQSMSQLFEIHKINRNWMKDFLWGMERMRQELGRYLLEERNVIWSPEHIYQDLEKNDFYFLYIPYYNGENGLKKLLNFWVEHIDYEDEALVEFVYGLHEQYDTAGEACLDGRLLEKFLVVKEKYEQSSASSEPAPEQENPVTQMPVALAKPEPAVRRKGILSFLEGHRKKQEPSSYREILQRQVSVQTMGAVCEEIAYDTGREEEYGKTVYMEDQREQIRGLYRDNGELAVQIEKLPFVIGKKKEEVDYVLGDRSVSRIHARILEENGNIYLEDLNSTNGTFKNGLRMQPYEKRRLEKNDELRFGKVEYIFR